MTGKIIKGIAGFYYVHDGVSKVYECKAKGVFRNRKIKPLVGDNVEFDVLSEEQSLSRSVTLKLLCANVNFMVFSSQIILVSHYGVVDKRIPV